jgi:hypothetical protein
MTINIPSLDGDDGSRQEVGQQGEHYVTHLRDIDDMRKGMALASRVQIQGDPHSHSRKVKH